MSTLSVSKNLVAVFVGGTSGVGQGMAEVFNRHTKGNSHIVLVGRNRDAAERVISNMKAAVAQESRYVFKFPS
jgi:NADP-dependent 3-hydroxy acid dehydrogenase YdfG